MRAMTLPGDGGIMRTSLTSSAGRAGTTRILLVDDHEISRGLPRTVAREGIDVVADLAASDHALAAARALRPDVAIVDDAPGPNTGFGIARGGSRRRLPGRQ